MHCFADILHTVLGLPTECVHHNKVRACKLSFSCWLQGGKHAQGCGNNKWLFSCCISENDVKLTVNDFAKNGKTIRKPAAPPEYLVSTSSSIVSSREKENKLRPPTTKLKGKFPKKNILRRRTDDSNVHQV